MSVNSRVLLLPRQKTVLFFAPKMFLYSFLFFRLVLCFMKNRHLFALLKTNNPANPKIPTAQMPETKWAVISSRFPGALPPGVSFSVRQ
jgi:hypothetical protein